MESEPALAPTPAHRNHDAHRDLVTLFCLLCGTYVELIVRRAVEVELRSRVDAELMIRLTKLSIVRLLLTTDVVCTSTDVVCKPSNNGSLLILFS